MASQDIYNADELEPPYWITKEYIANILKEWKHYEEAITVKNMHIKPASLQGDHYLSVLFRITVDYQTTDNDNEERISLILKTIPEMDGKKKEILETINAFDAEIYVYKDLLPQFETMLRSIGDDMIFAPQLIYCSLAPKKVLILEDLQPLGYKVLRQRQVNLEETKNAYTKLAKFHAISYKLNSECPELFERFDVIETMDNFLNATFLQNCYDNFISIIKEIPDLAKHVDYFERIKLNAYNHLRNTFVEYRTHRKPNKIYVLNHGDFHGKNILLQYTDSNEKKFVDSKVIDYQVVYMGSSVCDLLYSRYMLFDDNLRANHQEELIKFYWDIFIDTLKKLEFNGIWPTWEQLMDEFKEYRIQEMTLFTTYLPLYYGYRTGEVDPELAMFDKEYCRKIYNNADYQKELMTLMPHFEKMGYFRNE